MSDSRPPSPRRAAPRRHHPPHRRATDTPPDGDAAAPPRVESTTVQHALREATRRLHDVRAAVGLLLLGGITLAALGTIGFAWLASGVRAGRTQAFDDAVLTWFGAHRGAPWFEAMMLEVTFLGTASVVLLLAIAVAVFLALTDHRWSAALLLAATTGGIGLNSLLKELFDRPRPQLFAWGTHALTTSFPSGHAMSSAAVYGTLAYLAARLARRRAHRAAIWAFAAGVIAFVCASRMYLGVHYPSDVLAGLIVGLAWAGFCMALLEAVRRFGRRRGGGE